MTKLRESANHDPRTFDAWQKNKKQKTKNKKQKTKNKKQKTKNKKQKIQDPRSKIQDPRFRIQDSGFRIQDSGFFFGYINDPESWTFKSNRESANQVPDPSRFSIRFEGPGAGFYILNEI